MKDNREQVLAWVGLSEGGYVNHPKDPGGATDRGITQRTYDSWNRLKGRSPKPVRGISKDEAEKIIFWQYMVPVKFDDLPAGVDYAVADYSVNSGPSQAAKDLQRVVGVTPDGVIGMQTLAALSRLPPEKVVIDLCSRRMAFLRSLKTWRTFGKGWSARVLGNVDGVQATDIGVIDRGVRLARGAATIPAPVGSAGGAKSDPAQTSIFAALIALIRSIFAGK